MKHVLVTGARGFLGTHVVRSLLSQEFLVTALLRDKSRPTWIPPFGGPVTNLTWMHAEVEALSQVDRLPSGTTIVHLAGNPNANQRNREMAIANETRLLGGVLAAALRSHGCRVIYASSSAVYGKPLDYPISEDFPVSAATPYTSAKLRAEEMLVSAGIDCVALRLFNVYGPGQSSGSVMGKICSDAAAGTATFENRDLHLETPIDFVYVGDIARVITSLASVDSWPRPTMNVGSGRSVFPSRLADGLIRHSGSTTGLDIPTERGVGSASRALLESVVPGQVATPLSAGVDVTLDWTRWALRRAGRRSP